MYKIFRLIIIILLCLLIACSSTNSSPDGDVDVDKLDSVSELDLETNPCNASDVDCTPGYCEIKSDFVRGTYARCICPDGYVSNEHKCVAIIDGDKIEIDGDIELDIDIDTEKDSEEIEIYESCQDETAGPFKGIPCCSNTTNVYPCMAELDFEYTNDKGEFRVGLENVDNLYVLGVWNEFILYAMAKGEYTGIYLFDYKSKRFVRLGAYDNRTLHGAIRDNAIVWEEVEEINAQDLQLWGSLWTSSLTQVGRTKLPTSETAKFTQRIFEDNIYWKGINRKAGESMGHIYTINNSGQEEQVDQSLIKISDFSVYGNTMVWSNTSNQLIKFDLETKTETLIFDSGWPSGTFITTADTIYISDLSTSPDPGTHCGVSINAFDLTTFEKKTIKANASLTDYFIDDIWEDWMVYANCNEGNPDPDKNDQCCTGWAHGDIFLHQLSTGEEWNLTNTFGDQVVAKIWGPIVIWRDGRNLESGEGSALYGIDLCLHPELKDKFDECKLR